MEASEASRSGVVLLPQELQMSGESGLRRRGRRPSPSLTAGLLRCSSASAAVEAAVTERQQQEREKGPDGEKESGGEDNQRAEGAAAAAAKRRDDGLFSRRQRGEDVTGKAPRAPAAAAPSIAAAIRAAALPGTSGAPAAAAARVRPAAVAAAGAATAALSSSFPSAATAGHVVPIPSAAEKETAEVISESSLSPGVSSATNTTADASAASAARPQHFSSARTDSYSSTPQASSSWSSSASAPGAHVTRLFLQVTPSIRRFLLQSSNGDAQRTAAGDVVDLDCLMEWVEEHNKSSDKEKRVKISELMEDTYIVGKEAVQVDLSTLSASERLRMRSEERKFQQTLRSIFGSRPEENFASYTQSIALGVNALLGVFLMFLAGYWVSEYCGVTNVTAKVSVGIISSFGCLVVEVLLLLLHDERQQRKKQKREAQRRYYDMHPR